MKRYIKSNYTMDFDNKFEVMTWLDYAEKKIVNFCKVYSGNKYYYEVDDVAWGTNSFAIPVWRGDNEEDLRRMSKGKFPRPVNIDTFKFRYDPEDDRSAIDQVDDAVSEFLRDLRDRIAPEDRIESSTDVERAYDDVQKALSNWNSAKERQDKLRKKLRNRYLKDNYGITYSKLTKTGKYDGKSSGQIRDEAEEASSADPTMQLLRQNSEKYMHEHRDATMRLKDEYAKYKQSGGKFNSDWYWASREWDDYD